VTSAGGGEGGRLVTFGDKGGGGVKNSPKTGDIIYG